MRLPDDAIIPSEKLTDYLLVPRLKSDKSRFLAQGGFHSGNWECLQRALRELAADREAVEEGTNEYGVFFRVSGDLLGPSGQCLPVVTIWLRWHVDGRYHFVTLKPEKEGQR